MSKKLPVSNDGRCPNQRCNSIGGQTGKVQDGAEVLFCANHDCDIKKFKYVKP